MASTSKFFCFFLFKCTVLVVHWGIGQREDETHFFHRDVCSQCAPHMGHYSSALLVFVASDHTAIRLNLDGHRLNFPVSLYPCAG